MTAVIIRHFFGWFVCQFKKHQFELGYWERRNSIAVWHPSECRRCGLKIPYQEPKPWLK